MSLILFVIAFLSFSLKASDQVEAHVNKFEFTGGKKAAGMMDVERIFLRVKGIEFETSKENCRNCSRGLFDTEIKVTKKNIAIKGLFSLKIPAGKKNYIKDLHRARLRDAKFSLVKNRTKLSTDFFRFHYGDIDFRLSKSLLSCTGKNRKSQLDLDFVMDSCFNSMLMHHRHENRAVPAVFVHKEMKNLHVRSDLNSIEIDKKHLKIDLKKAHMLIKNKYVVDVEDSNAYCNKGTGVNDFVKECQDSLVMIGRQAYALNKETDNGFKLELRKYRAEKKGDDVSFRFRKFLMPLGFLGNFSLNVDGFFGKCIGLDLEKGFDKSCFSNGIGSLWGVHAKLFTEDAYDIKSSLWLKKFNWSFSDEIKSASIEFLRYDLGEGKKIRAKEISTRLLVSSETAPDDLKTLSFDDQVSMSLGSFWLSSPWVDEDNPDSNLVFNIQQVKKSEDRLVLNIPYLFTTKAKGTTGIWGIEADCEFFNNVDFSTENIYRGCLNDGVLSVAKIYSHGREFKDKNAYINIHRNIKMFYEAGNKEYFKGKLKFDKLTAEKIKIEFSDDQSYKLTGKFVLFDRLLSFMLAGKTSAKVLNDGRLEIKLRVEKSNLPVIGKFSRWVMLRVTALIFNDDDSDSLEIAPSKKSIYLRL